MKITSQISPQTDSVLCPTIRPGGTQSASDTVFLTGATGFLGAQVLAEILRTTDWKVVCLVRADNETIAARRISAALASTGRDYPDYDRRVIPLCGNLSEPDFGLAADDMDTLAATVGQIIHCAAEVTWIKPYRHLRGSHITGTLNVIRLACRGSIKPLHFVSTLAICYVPDGPTVIDEATDMSAYLDQIPLGYAQAKCVAEMLLRQAAERGLPVSILRCGLICGDSVSGMSNHEDIISRMLRGTVSSGISPDVDWGLDCVPVDTVAQALCALVKDIPSGLRVLHLRNDVPRLWREMVLWLSLNGYDVSLVSLDEWLEMIGDREGNRAPDLHVLHPFFLARPPLMRGRSLTELYLEPKRQCIQSTASHSYFQALGLSIPRLDSHLLNRYLAVYRQQGFLPKHKTNTEMKAGLLLHKVIAKGLAQALDAPKLELSKFSSFPLSGSGVLSELSTASSGGRTGLWRCLVQYRRAPNHTVEQVQAVLKLRSTNAEQDAATLAVAGLCSPRLGAAYAAYMQHLPYRNGLAREIAIAASGDSRLASFMPRALAVITPSNDTHGGLLEEFLEDVDLLDSADAMEYWRDEHVEAAVQALGQIHSVWYRREEELLQQPWITDGKKNIPAMLPLWRELADFSAVRFSSASGENIRAIQHGIIDDLERWWPQWMSMPCSLVHNDFSPRNLAFRRTPQGPALCVYDWELATIGLPQYDLAELLCFVLPASSSMKDAQYWIDMHRRCLEKASGKIIPAKEWQSGFALALRQYMMSRLPFYAMIDRFKPQLFLSRVVNNWLRLHQWSEKSGSCTASTETHKYRNMKRQIFPHGGVARRCI